MAGSAAAGTVAFASGDPLIGYCASIVALIGAARVLSAAVYRDHLSSDGKLPGRVWEMLYEGGAWTFAAMLGAVVYLTLTRTADIGLHLITATVSTGYAAGIAGRNAGRPAIAIGQTTLASLPMSIALFQNNDMASWVLAVINLLFIASLIDITTQLYSAFRDAFSAKHEKALLANRFERLARIDTLTGLENRFAFQERLEAVFREQPRPKIAIFWIDLDRFKEINDTLGHPVGDHVLRSVGYRLRQITRGRGHVARFGGDEFVILAEITDTPSTLALAEDVLHALAEPLSDETVTLEVRASMGVALSPDHGIEAEQLLKRADLALYYAKSSGRSRYCLFERAMQQRFDKAHEIESGLRLAIEKGELELFFQPIVDVQTGLTSSCEALLRWRHPLLGEVPPSEFVPIAETIGMMPKITEWVLQTACSAAAAWPRDVRVSINISPVSFKDPGFPLKVLAVLHRAKLDPQRLELEVTETVLLEENEQSTRMLRELRLIGVRLSLDDFGTGYSSLAYLRRYTFDSIKIDTSFVSDLHTSKEAKAIINAVVGLADALEIETVAEGVETVQQLRSVRAAGCTNAQGYLLGLPMQLSRISEWLIREDESRVALAELPRINQIGGS